MTTSHISVLGSVSAAPWELPEKGLNVLSTVAFRKRSVCFTIFSRGRSPRANGSLCLDGANRFDQLLIARFARERKLQSAEFGHKIRVARAFACFRNLTELLVRVPRACCGLSPAQIVLVTALPDLYFDEDIREREAISSFQRALHALKAAERLLLPVAVFTGATSSHSPRRALLQHLIAQADQVMRFTPAEGAGFVLTCEKSAPAIPKALP